MEGGSSRNGIKCVVVCKKKKKKGKKIHYYKCKVPFASIVLATALQKAKLVYLEIRGKRIQSLLIAPQFVTFTPPPRYNGQTALQTFMAMLDAANSRIRGKARGPSDRANFSLIFPT